MSLVWDVKFPTQGQKLVMLRMADYANDDGESVFPSNDEVARQCGLTKRGAQYILLGFHNCGLMVVTEKGGFGQKKKTNRRKIDVEMLIDLALTNRILEGSKDELRAVDNKGELSAPLNLARVHQRAARVNQRTLKGEPGFIQSTNNHQLEPSSASADARDSSRTAHAVDEKPLTMFELTPADVTWKIWLTLMDAKGRTDLADEAIEAGKIQVRTKWPDPERGLQGLIVDKPLAKSKSKTKPRADYTNRMLGEGEAA